MLFPIQVIRVGNSWTATSILIPVYYSFGSTPMEAVDNFKSAYGVMEKLSPNNVLTFKFHIIRELEDMNV